jgi:WD40 repeat protein
LAADVRSVAFQPHDVYLACGTASGDIFLETLSYRHAAPKYRRWLRGHRSSVNALSFRADLSLASGSADHTVRLWDLTQSDTEPEAVGRDDKDPEDFDTEPIVLTGHPSWVWSVAFLPGGDRLISGSADHTVRIWEARSKNIVDELCKRVPHRLPLDQWSKFFGNEILEDEGEVCPK